MSEQKVRKYRRSSNGTECYKYCFVPHCRSTTKRTPGKVFLYVPKSKSMRKKWCAAAGCPDKTLRPSTYICEDHFDLQEDLKNYTYWKMMGGPKTFRRDACPRYFACQANNATPTVLDHMKPPKDPLASTEVPVTFVSSETVQADLEFIVPDDLDTLKEDTAQAYVSPCPLLEQRFTHTKKLIISSRGITMKPTCRTVGVMATPIVCNAGTSPCIIIETNKKSMDTHESAETAINTFTESKTCIQKISVTASEKCYPIKIESLRSTIFQSTTKVLIEQNSLLFIGVPKDALTDLHVLAKTQGLSIEDIYLVLKKTRQNISNAVLAHYFGIPETRIDRIFACALPIIAKFCRQYIVWPSGKDILFNLPEKFSKRYGQVQSIIDCFEIQIEHLEDPNNHTIFKKGSTKYLISVTPDGMINYISRGYPGLRTDASIAEISGYLEVLPNRVAVLADRSLKSIDVVLSKKKCTLIRPPVVLSGPESNTVFPTATKHIDNVRVYVNEIVTQLRDFKLLGSHSTVEECLLPHLDDAVVVAAGLTNLQRKIA